jgi:hypothetical protein
MLKYFFELQVKEDGKPISRCLVSDKPVVDTSNYLLFSHLEISKSKYIMDNYFGKYPIILLNFTCGLIKTIEHLKQECRRCISDAYQQHKYLMKSSRLSSDEKLFCQKWCSYTKSKLFDDSDVFVSLRRLSYFLEKHFQRKSIVLVDEYDAMCSQALFKLKTAETIKDAIFYFISILGFLLKDNSSIFLGFVIGISFICTTGLSTITNLKPFKFLQNKTFIKLYGLSEEEVDCLLNFQITKDDKDEIKRFYNGYEFEAQKLYSLWSLMSYVSTREIRNYWIESGIFVGLKGALTIPAVKFGIQHLLQGKTMNIDALSKLYPDDVLKLKENIENPNFMIQNVSILFNFYLEQGYLTICRRTRNQLEIRIPNEEIRSEFMRLYEEYFTDTWGIDHSLVQLCAVCFNNVFENPQENLKEICCILKKILCKATLEDEHPLNEAALHHIVYFITLYTRYKCCTEIYCNPKRLDLSLIFENFGLIIEFKYNKSSNEALQQILEKIYYKIFEDVKYVYQNIEHYILIGLNISEVDKNIDLELGFLINSMEIKNKIKVKFVN